MRKLKTLLTLIALSVGALQFALADRVAPTLPMPQALESGTSYYLYNVQEGKFASRSTSSTSYPALGTYGEKVKITATTKQDEYTIQWASNNYYWYATDSYITSSSSKSKESYFTISESSMGYTIQRSPSNTSYYQADEFIGFNANNDDRLNPALAEGSIHWQLMAVDDAEYYFAKHKLYTYLEVADQYNFYVTQYDLVYNNTASTTEELNEAQLTLENALSLSQNYVSPNWTEYPILFQNNTNNKWELYNSNQALYWYIVGRGVDETSTLTATVNVNEDVTLSFKCYTGNSYCNFRVFLDGELVQTITNNVCNSFGSYNNCRYYVEMGAGKHDIKWECQFVGSSANSGFGYSSYLSEIGIQKTPTITPATTTTEGQLGTEVLKLVDPVSSVKKIVINGIIGADDWTTIGLMVNAFSIDMSGATATAPMPNNMFNGSKFSFLHNVKLPQGLTAIGDYAFYESDVENEMIIPESLKTIGEGAFRESKIKATYMSDGITSIGNYAFEKCYHLENITYPATAVKIPYYCFEDCYNLRSFVIPEGITEVGQYAFCDCMQFNARFPSTMKRVGFRAFDTTATDSLFVTEDMKVISRAFDNCQNLVYAEWPTSFAQATNDGNTNGTNGVVTNCPKLNKVKLKSPTVVKYDQGSFFSGNKLANITLLVPDFLVSAYKLDPYWYKCNVQGFSSADIADWNITQPLILNSGQRIGGMPSLHFSGINASFTVNGDDVQSINNLSNNYCPKEFSYYDTNDNYYSTGVQWGMMLGNSSHTNITGELSENVMTEEKTWYFFTLSFDTKVGDITATALETGASTSFAIRYYDGASRASNGSGGNWKNYTVDDIIPAGTGFIYQTAKDATSKFVAQNNASKQYVLSNNEFVKALAANPSDVTANKGWNLVGNPWQTYYNIHKLNFTAPITVWNMSSRKYVAYSIIDDDYAIKPLEAIFVQCPDEINSLSFPIDGRQLTSVIESQSGARATSPSERKLIDVEITDGELSDKTRFVLNPQAKMGYELTCDAAKFMSMDGSVPQLYTIEQGTRMAINERPIGDGTILLGFKVAQDGTYTMSAPRNQLKNIVLVDNETGVETDLTAEGSYTFTADVGSNDSRFMLRVGGTAITAVQSVTSQAQQMEQQTYNLNGQRIRQLQKGLYIVNGKKVIIK